MTEQDFINAGLEYEEDYEDSEIHFPKYNLDCEFEGEKFTISTDSKKVVKKIMEIVD